MNVSVLLRSRRFRLLAVAALLLTAYGALGAWYAPRVLQQQAQQWVRTNLDRELATGRVRINPFLFRVELADLSLPDADGAPLIAWQRLVVDFEVASLWRRAWVFREISLEAPMIRAVRRADGRFNLADLAPPRDASEPPPADAALPRLWIRDLAVTAGDVEYVDHANRTEPLQRRMAPVTFRLQDFRTTGEGGDFQLAARSSADEAFEWRGRMALAPVPSTSGEFSISRLRLAGVWEFLPESLRLVARSGLVDLNGSYAVTLDPEPSVSVDLPLLAISDVGLGPRDGDAIWIRARRIALEQLALRQDARTLRAAKFRVEGLAADTWMDERGQLNVATLLAPAQSANSAAALPATADRPAASDAQAPAWSMQLDAVELDDAAVAYTDRRNAAATPLRLAPLAVTTGAISSDLSRPLPVRLTATLNDAATLRLSGELAPAPLAARVDVDIEGLQLALIKPYALPDAALTVRSGTAATRGQLAITPAGEAAPEIRYQGEVQLASLHAVDDVLREDLIRFAQLSLEKLDYSSQPARLGIARVALRQPYARLVVSPEQVTNIAAVLDPEGTEAKRAAFREALAAGREPPEVAEEESDVQPAAAGGASGQAGMAVRIGEVAVQRGTLNFTDLYIRPNFAAEIRELTGSIEDLSSAADSRAAVDLAGSLGEFSPVTITGSIQPFAFDRHTDIRMHFGNIALPVFNPYSGTFAGYNIARGALTTDLHYQIGDRQLTAGHQIRIEQLEWGEASEFRGEATLPVKFATALLRDRHGVITLDLPVTGSLDDPKLRIGPLVWQVLKNIIVKAATAPFALLGSLFAGAEEAQFVRFPPGEAVLDEATATNLAALAQSLAEKEGIAVDIPLGTVGELDRPALIERGLRAQLESAAPGYESLAPAAQRAVLAALFTARRMPLPATPPAAEPPVGTLPEAASALVDQAAVDALEQQLRATVVVSDGDLEQLAQRRAEAVQRALLASGELAPARVFVVREGEASNSEGRVQLQLNLR